MMRKYLKELRTKACLSQEAVASKIGVTQVYYSLIENGMRKKKMDINLVLRLSSIFNVPVEEIIAEEKRIEE